VRILLVSQFYPPVTGGQERHVRDLALALVGRGHEVEVATISSGGRVGTSDDGEVKVHRLQSSAQRFPRIYSETERPHATPVADPRLRAQIRELVSSRGFDVLHAHDWIVNSVLGAAGRSGPPVVLTMHDYSHVCATKRMMRGNAVCPGPEPVACVRCASAMYGRVMGPGVYVANTLQRRRRQSRVSAFVSVSSAVADRAQLDSTVHSVVIPNFVPDSIVMDAAKWADADQIASEGPILFAGDLRFDKGVTVLLAAYEQLSDPPPLLMAGRTFPDTPLASVRGAEVLGPVPAQDMQDLMRSARVVVVPSIVGDACPTVVLEAMAAGRPVVGAASGGIPELVAEGSTGLLVPPGDAASLAGAMASLLASPAETSEMGRRGLERVHSFTASAVTEQLEGLYLDLVRNDETRGERPIP
jgi:glycogen synthase